jgi:hypothetical protein
MPEVLIQLRAQRGLQHLPSQPGQQPARPGQLHTARAGRRHQLLSQRRQIRLDRTIRWLHIDHLRGHA